MHSCIQNQGGTGHGISSRRASVHLGDVAGEDPRRRQQLRVGRLVQGTVRLQELATGSEVRFLSLGHRPHDPAGDRSRRQWDDRGFSTFVEDQNSFRLRGDVATLAGKPDLIAVNGTRAVISDAKTGQPKPSHQAQVMLYMYAVPSLIRLTPRCPEGSAERINDAGCPAGGSTASCRADLIVPVRSGPLLLGSRALVCPAIYT